MRSSTGAPEKVAGTDADAEEAFIRQARMTPGERVRDAILKLTGTTEDELAGMPAEKRHGIEDTIKEKIVGALADVKV